MSQDYPTRPVRIVTSPAGGGSDQAARLVAQGLSPLLGQQVIVDNRPAILAPVVVAKSPPDGYTVLDYVAVIDRKFQLRQICAIGQGGPAKARSGRPFAMSEYDLLREEANHDARALWVLVLERADGEKIALMLENGHSLNERVEGTTPLGLAILHGQDAAVDLLLKLGASPDVRGAYGTPLADAMLYGREQSVVSLLKHGARSTGLSNMDPLEMAITLGRPEILRILLDAGFRASSRHLELAREQPEKRDQLVRILVGAISKH